MNLVAHAVMFHHFFDENHPRGQGAISASDFHKLIDEIESSNRLIGAREWLKLAQQEKLKDEICFSFDDGLACQYEIALPVLKERNLDAFWFIYTSVIEGHFENLEVYRHFRTTCFKSIDDFYVKFFKELEELHEADLIFQKIESSFNENDYLKDFPFYSLRDKKFRFVRDQVIGQEQYHEVMRIMIDRYNYMISHNKLWMNESEVKDLTKLGHVVGLHSHNHHTQLASLPVARQKEEYTKNKEVLEMITKEKVVSMSHPCNSYNSETLELLDQLGIKIGFCSNMSELNRKGLEFPREDHANLHQKMKL